MYRQFYSLLTVQGHRFYLLPNENECFVFERNNSLYRSIVLKVNLNQSKSPTVYLDFLGRKALLWNLPLIEFFFCYCPVTNRCWLLEAGTFALAKTSISLNRFSDSILAPSTNVENRAPISYNDEEEDRLLINRLTNQNQ